MKKFTLSALLLMFFGILTIANSSAGEQSFTYSGGNYFKGELKASGLKQRNGYVLCINGKYGLPGNEILFKHYQKSGNQGYYDFKTVKTDSNGSLNIKFKIKLPRGKYNVKFAIKEKPNYKWIEIDSIVIFEIK